MSRSEDARPSERQIGARVRIKPDYQTEVEALFNQARIAPMYKELRADGNISYWFGKDQVAPLGEAAVLEQIPIHYWAHYSVIGEPPIRH